MTIKENVKRGLADPVLWFFVLLLGEFLWSWHRNDVIGTVGWGTLTILAYMGVGKDINEKGSEKGKES